jgi:hypothetical protein
MTRILLMLLAYHLGVGYAVARHTEQLTGIVLSDDELTAIVLTWPAQLAQTQVVVHRLAHELANPAPAPTQRDLEENEK